MELTRLAARQKRYRDILRFSQVEVSDQRLKSVFAEKLQEYQKALGECWQGQGISTQHLERLESVERDLDSLFNEARLRTAMR